MRTKRTETELHFFELKLLFFACVGALVVIFVFHCIHQTFVQLWLAFLGSSVA